MLMDRPLRQSNNVISINWSFLGTSDNRVLIYPLSLVIKHRKLETNLTFDDAFLSLKLIKTPVAWWEYKTDEQTRYSLFLDKKNTDFTNFSDHSEIVIFCLDTFNFAFLISYLEYILMQNHLT